MAWVANRLAVQMIVPASQRDERRVARRATDTVIAFPVIFLIPSTKANARSSIEIRARSPDADENAVRQLLLSSEGALPVRNLLAQVAEMIRFVADSWEPDACKRFTRRASKAWVASD
jgi:hypothetical protein